MDRTEDPSGHAWAWTHPLAHAHLVDLLPAILIPGPQLGMVMEKQLTAEGIPAP